MTTNREKAAEIIAPWLEKEWGHPEDNAESAADALDAAGVLAPEAVAEVVRLRRELEEQLKELSDELEAEGVETHDDIDGTWPSMQRYGELSEMLFNRDFLTRILEGHNDE